MAKPMFTTEVETKAFNRHIRNFLKGSNIDVELGLKKFAFDLIARIIAIDRMPVDTGRARGGWIYSAEKLMRDGAGGKFIATTKSGNYSLSAENEGKRMGKYSENFRGPNKWIEIVNGVRYIVFLEYGHSKQAPFGMVRVSMREMRGGKLPRDMGARLKKRWNKFYMTG